MSGTILGPDGSVANLPSETLSDDELRLLAEYKKFLQVRGYREALYCQRCWGRDLSDGCDAHVKTSGFSVEAMIKCRCRLVYGKGGGLAH